MMGQQNPKIQAMQLRQDPNVYVRTWTTPLHKTCCANCGYCAFSLFCPYCASFQLRKQALYGDLTRYICCNGACPCSGRCGEQNCPAFCLCMEAVCCFGMSVATTRYMIQDELRVQTTACDNCIIGFMIALQYISCICNIVACILGNSDIQALANCIDLLADVAWCTVCACMQTQHRIELGERDKGMQSGRPAVVMAPAPQMIAMGNYPPPPPGGYQGGPPAQGYASQQPQHQAPPPGHAPQQPKYNQYAPAAPGYPPQPQYKQGPAAYPTQQSAYR